MQCDVVKNIWMLSYEMEGGGGFDIPTRNLFRQGRRRAFHLYQACFTGPICFDNMEGGEKKKKENWGKEGDDEYDSAWRKTKSSDVTDLFFLGGVGFNYAAPQ